MNTFQRPPDESGGDSESQSSRGTPPYHPPAKHPVGCPSIPGALNLPPSIPPQAGGRDIVWVFGISFPLTACGEGLGVGFLGGFLRLRHTEYAYCCRFYPPSLSESQSSRGTPPYHPPAKHPVGCPSIPGALNLPPSIPPQAGGRDIVWVFGISFPLTACGEGLGVGFLGGFLRLRHTEYAYCCRFYPPSLSEECINSCKLASFS